MTPADPARAMEPPERTWPHIDTATLIRQARYAANRFDNGPGSHYIGDTIRALCERLDLAPAPAAPEGAWSGTDTIAEAARAYVRATGQMGDVCAAEERLVAAVMGEEWSAMSPPAPEDVRRAALFRDLLARLLPLAEMGAARKGHEGSCGPWEYCDAECMYAYADAKLMADVRAALASPDAEEAGRHE